jgi:hypothetical protein
MKNHIYILISFLFVVLTGRAQDELTATDWAKNAQNPLSEAYRLPLQDNTTFRIGANNSIQNILNFQPVIPLEFEKFNIIGRFVVPFVSTPDAGDVNAKGMGDMKMTVFFASKPESSVSWGLGPVFQFPTASNDQVGSGLFGMGLSMAVTVTNEHWVYGFLVDNIWTLDVYRTENKMFLQPIINYNFPAGWYIVSEPQWQANWHATKDQWLIPLGAGVGKLFRIGKTALNMSAHFYYNTAMQDPEWGKMQSRLQVELLLPR